jgi:hypothetical protein
MAEDILRQVGWLLQTGYCLIGYAVSHQVGAI